MLGTGLGAAWASRSVPSGGSSSALAPRLPHRSVRADFPHTARQSMDSQSGDLRRRSPILAIRGRCVEMLRDSVFPSSFPRAVPRSGTPFPPQGPLDSFPCFSGTTAHSDSSSSIPRAVGFPRASVPPVFRRGLRGLPGSWGTLCAGCHVLGPRSGRPHRRPVDHSRCVRCCHFPWRGK